MLSGLVHEQRGVTSGPNPGRDLRKVQGHRFRVAPGQHEPGCLALGRADRAKDVGGRCALVLRCARPGAARSPAPCDLVVLPDSGLVAEPDLHVGRIEALSASNGRYKVGETFLKASTAPSACAWWRGRADSLRYCMARNS